MSKRRPNTSTRPRWTVTWPNTCVWLADRDAKIGRQPELQVGVLARDPELARRHSRAGAAWACARAGRRCAVALRQRVAASRPGRGSAAASVDQDDVGGARRAAAAPCAAFSGSSMRASSMSTIQAARRAASRGRASRRQRYDRQWLPFAVERQGDRSLASAVTSYALPHRGASRCRSRVRDPNRSPPSARRARRRRRRRGAPDRICRYSPKSGHCEDAVGPFEPAREARRRPAYRARSATRSAARRSCAAPATTPDRPCSSKPLRVQARVDRRPSNVRRASPPGIRDRPSSPRSRAAFRRSRRQSRIELRLPVGVARLDLAHTDRRLVEDDVAHLCVKERRAARRACRRR